MNSQNATKEQRPELVAQSKYTRQPHEKATIGEVQALISAGMAEGTRPLMSVAKASLLMAGLAVTLSVVAFVLAIVK